MSFRKLEAQVVAPSKTVPLVINQLRGDPILHVEYLGETNAEYWSDAIAHVNSLPITAGGKRQKITEDKIRENRSKNREIVAKHSVRELENVFHDDGKLAGPEDIRDVVFSLPDDVFDTVWAFVNDPNNFREAIAGDPSETAKK